MLLALTLSFVVNIPNDSYFIALRNKSSAKLYRNGSNIELLLLENKCFEKFHIPLGNKTSFIYNLTNNSVDGVQLVRYDGNCIITQFDYNNVLFNETCPTEHEVLFKNSSSTYDNIEYFICVLIPLLLLARSDNLYMLMSKLRHRILAQMENTLDGINNMISEV